jgi:predicted nucleotide-binding protein
MQKPIAERLDKLTQEGSALESTDAAEQWSKKVSAFLRAAIGETEAQDFLRLDAFRTWDTHALRMGHLEGLIARAASESPDGPAASAQSMDIRTVAPNNPASDSIKVFVVHGHDNEAKEGTARFLQRIGLQPIVLHEQPNSGRTIIEKFETYSGDIAFAVVLLTPDDLGSAAASPDNSRPRARQNVILELGYFMGRLGRHRVCALHKGGVELPSDYQGVLYIELDPAGAWKAKLAQEFVQAKLPIDLSGLLGG